MRKLTVMTFLTLDGIMQAPGGPQEDPSGAFPHGGWSFDYFDEMLGEVMAGEMAEPFDLLLGRRTYEIFAAHWPDATPEEGGEGINAATKYVASRSPQTFRWAKSVQLEGDAAQAVAALKQTDGPELQVHGSSDLIQTLLRAGLVDEFRIKIFPVVLGRGKRLFGDGTLPSAFRLVSTRTSERGVIVAYYQPAGAVTTGSFARE
ncbi:dihydrofolate reductase family protein [Kineosporia babensis]|uniref:Dihydrofolate reductase family protein n=1 Tax=Kineosporia babensis TaxID=499548 RepID=A0A9X1NEZ3_9ACTN|nr:dihydrofolate reductase family protein [Kineosporia babensis]MCD5312908.1 dihydrofolate reductase family protein [Kineosporia babensis]